MIDLTKTQTLIGIVVGFITVAKAVSQLVAAMYSKIRSRVMPEIEQSEPLWGRRERNSLLSRRRF